MNTSAIAYVILKGLAQVPILAILIVVLAFVGVISILRSLFPYKAPPKSNRLPSQVNESASINKEAFRLKLEDLFFNKKISLETKNEIFSFLKFKTVQPASSPENKPPEKSQIVSEPPKTIPPVKTNQPVKPSSPTPHVPSGFFSSDNIKTLLISGTCLFVFSAYLFVRSYWEMIPDALKFISLALTTGAIYGIGKFLFGKKEIPKTVETLLTLSTVLIPFNFYAANVLLLQNAFGAYASWAWGFLAMSLMSTHVIKLIPTFVMGLISGLGFVGFFLFGGLALDLSQQGSLMMTASGALLLLGVIVFVELKDTIRQGCLLTVNGTCGFIAIGLFMNGLFLNVNGHLPTVGTLILTGIIFAIQGRAGNVHFAYGAGISFFSALGVLLHHFELPLYKYGLAYIPAGLLAEFRAWKFEKSGKKDLAQPYFHLGQLAIAGSILAVLPYFNFYIEGGFLTLLTVLLAGTLAYSISAVLYKNPVFTFASGLVVLFTAFAYTWHHQYSFSISALVFAGTAAFLILAGLIAGPKNDDLIGTPLSILGLVSITVCLSLLAGKWGVDYLKLGSVEFGLSPDHLKAGISVGLMSVLAYTLLAIVRKQVALVFPAFASATLVYLFTLESFSIPINALNISWVVVASIGLYYVTHFLGWTSLSRSFVVWGEIIFFGLAVGSLSNPSHADLVPLLICGILFVPGLLMGSPDLVFSFLSNTYLLHYLWFYQATSFKDENLFSYSGQLLIINCGILFIRTLLSTWKPKYTYVPYKIFVGLFTIVSLLTALYDQTSSWQIYLAYGIISIIVSKIHYQGRFDFIGTTLLLVAYELFLVSKDVKLVEAYSLPAGLYLLICGFLYRDNKDLRNTLYAIGQVILYLPSFQEALQEKWQFHGIYLGVLSLIVMLVGMNLRNKCLTVGSLAVLLGNGFVQSAQFLTAIPRWIYLGLGGVTLVGLGGLFEFKREKLIKLKNQLASTLEEWD